MKKIIYSMSVVLLTVGCTQPVSLPQCADYYKDNNSELKKCINDNINAHLSPIGKSFQGGMVVNKKKSIPSSASTIAEPQYGTVITEPQYGTVMTEPQYGTIMTEPQYGTIIAEPQNGAVIVEPQNGAVIVEPQNGAVIVEPQNGAVIVEPQNGSVIVEHNRRKIISDINRMCDSLQKNYVKFNKPSTEARVIDKARKAYQSCKKEQKELKQGVK